jgi:hypothetical protein
MTSCNNRSTKHDCKTYQRATPNNSFLSAADKTYYLEVICRDLKMIWRGLDMIGIVVGSACCG